MGRGSGGRGGERRWEGGDGDGKKGGRRGEGSQGSARREAAIIQTIRGTGLGISELAGLKLEDVEVSERKGVVRIREGKGGKSRSVPLDNRTRLALLRYIGQ
mgnify:CR=1 FL=1